MVAEQKSNIDFENLVKEAEHLIEHRNPNAAALAEQIAHSAAQEGSVRNSALANYIMAFYHCLVLNDYDKTIQLCEEVLHKVDQIEIEEIIYKLYMTLGNAYQMKGEVFSAELWYMKGLKLLESKDNLTRSEKGFLASFYYNLSLVLGSTELNISAEDYLERAICLYEEIDYCYKLSKSYGAFASLLERKKEFGRAIEVMHKSLELDLQLKEPYNIALSHANLGILLLRINDSERGFKHMQLALDYFNKNSKEYETALVRMNLGEVLCSTGNGGKGLSELLEAETIFEQLENKSELTKLYELLATIYAESGDFEGAYKYHQKYVHNLKYCFDVEKVNALARARREFNTEQKEKEAGLLRQKNEEIKHYVLKLERSNNELNQFAHIASHDLREPLRMIASYIKLLQKSWKSDLSEQQTEFFGFIADASVRMDRLILDLLRLAKVDANPRKETVNLDKTLHEIAQNLNVQVKEKNALIVFAGLPEISADKTMVFQLLQNIISNGIKYNESAQPQVEITHSISAKSFEMIISDNGIGIPRHLREKAFQIFQRLHSAKNYEGSGIGLAICKKIVESMEGQITIDDNPSGGTIFRVTLPVSVLATI